MNKLLAPIRQKFTDPKLVELIAKAYPANSETFHQAGGPAATEANSTGVDDKDSGDDKPPAAAKTDAKDTKTGDAKKSDKKAGSGGAKGGKAAGAKKEKPEGAAVV